MSQGNNKLKQSVKTCRGRLLLKNFTSVVLRGKMLEMIYFDTRVWIDNELSELSPFKVVSGNKLSPHQRGSQPLLFSFSIPHPKHLFKG